MSWSETNYYVKSHVAGRLMCSCCRCWCSCIGCTAQCWQQESDCNVCSRSMVQSAHSSNPGKMGSSQVVQQALTAALHCKSFVLITIYLESIFCQQCRAAKTTNARSNHHNIGLLGGLLCLAWLLQGGASSCLSLACCQRSDFF